MKTNTKTTNIITNTSTKTCAACATDQSIGLFCMECGTKLLTKSIAKAMTCKLQKAFNTQKFDEQIPEEEDEGCFVVDDKEEMWGKFTKSLNTSEKLIWNSWRNSNEYNDEEYRARQKIIKSLSIDDTSAQILAKKFLASTYC